MAFCIFWGPVFGILLEQMGLFNLLLRFSSLKIDNDAPETLAALRALFKVSTACRCRLRL